MPTDKPRITFALDEDVLKSIDDYKFKHRIKNQSQAILTLIKKGLDGMDSIPPLDEKNSPASADAEEQISMEESNRLFDALVQAGLISDSIELSGDDRAFLIHVIGLLDVWIRSKRK